MTALGDEILGRLRAAYTAAAEPARAEPMAAYMRDQLRFLGIPAPLQDRMARGVLAGLPEPDEPDVVAVTIGCWQLSEREYRYFGCGFVRRYVTRCGPAFVDTLAHAITTDSWWDTVDALASRGVGPLVRAHPGLVATLDEWIEGDDMWLTRTALIHQLTYKARTDQERLFAYCARHAGHRDFFVRKAIGWALREYSKVAPEAVRAFVEAHAGELSGLSKREALRRIGA